PRMGGSDRVCCRHRPQGARTRFHHGVVTVSPTSTRSHAGETGTTQQDRTVTHGLRSRRLQDRSRQDAHQPCGQRSRTIGPLGSSLRGYPLFQRDPDRVRAATDTLGGLDVLVNAAGILRSSHTTETSLGDFMSVLNVNLAGTFLMIRETIPELLRGTEPVIVNFSSTSASFAHPYMSAYAASKGGIQSMTHALAAEYSKQGLR